ncbi:MAG: hypothetical protein L3J56_07450 [Bacteroidales bacterium]|nr:hypothetical protein [Bacteroidales bacterium]
MKKILFILSFSILGFNLFSQSSIKIYTDLEDEISQFIAYLNEEAQDAYPSDETEIEGLLPGKYILQVSFNSDTIADWTIKLKLKKNEHLIYKVVKMKKFAKDANQLGRNISKDAKDDDGLVQYYKLVQVREPEKK